MTQQINVYPVWLRVDRSTGYIQYSVSSPYQIIHFSGSTTLIQTQPHQMHLSFSIFDAIPLRCCERSLPVLDPLRGSLQLWLSTLPDLEECWIGMDSLEHQG